MKNSGGPVKIDSSSFVNVVREKPPPFSLRRFLYNEKEGTYLGKTKSSWGKNDRNNFFFFNLIICLLMLGIITLYTAISYMNKCKIPKIKPFVGSLTTCWLLILLLIGECIEHFRIIFFCERN